MLIWSYFLFFHQFIYPPYYKTKKQFGFIYIILGSSLQKIGEKKRNIPENDV